MSRRYSHFFPTTVAHEAACLHPDTADISATCRCRI